MPRVAWHTLRGAASCEEYFYAGFTARIRVCTREQLLYRLSGGHVAGRVMAGHMLFENRDLAQATGFLGPGHTRAQHRTKWVEAAARGDVGRIGGFAAQDLVRATTTDLGGHGEQGFGVG